MQISQLMPLYLNCLATSPISRSTTEAQMKRSAWRVMVLATSKSCRWQSRAPQLPPTWICRNQRATNNNTKWLFSKSQNINNNTNKCLHFKKKSRVATCHPQKGTYSPGFVPFPMNFQLHILRSVIIAVQSLMKHPDGNIVPQ